jgi:hypothetical protein
VTTVGRYAPMLPPGDAPDTPSKGDWSKDMTTPNLSNLLVAGKLNDDYRDAAAERLVHPRPLPRASERRPRPGFRVHLRRRLGWLSSAV